MHIEPKKKNLWIDDKDKSSLRNAYKNRYNVEINIQGQGRWVQGHNQRLIENKKQQQWPRSLFFSSTCLFLGSSYLLLFYFFTSLISGGQRYGNSQ